MRALLVAVTLFWLGSLSWTVAHATQPDDKFLQLLLRPAGWSAEWSGPGGSGRTEVVFVQQGPSFIAKISLITPFEMICENPAAIESNSVTFDGCRDPQVRLIYDANDREIPLRGRSPRGYEWKVKPK